MCVKFCKMTGPWLQGCFFVRLTAVSPSRPDFREGLSPFTHRWAGAVSGEVAHSSDLICATLILIPSLANWKCSGSPGEKIASSSLALACQSK